MDEPAKVSSRPARRWRLRRRAIDARFVWLGLATVLAGASTVAALIQPLRPGALDPPAFGSPAWWLHPVERNAWRRTPIVTAGLEDVAVAGDGRRLWAVGDGGLIVHSADGGRTWVQQPAPSMPGAPEAQPVEPPPEAKGGHPTQAQQQAPSSVAQQNFTQQSELLTPILPVPAGTVGKSNAPAMPVGQQRAPTGIGGGLARLAEAIEAAGNADDAKPLTRDLAAVAISPDGHFGWIGGDRVLLGRQGPDQPWTMLAGWEAIPTRIAAIAVDGSNGIAVGARGLVGVTGDGWQTGFAGLLDEGPDLNGLRLRAGGELAIVGDAGTFLYGMPGTGPPFRPIETGTGADLHAASFSGGDGVWVVGAAGTVLRGGPDFRQTYRLAPVRAFDGTAHAGREPDLFDVDFADARHGVAVGQRGIVLVTDSGGESWTTASIPGAPDLRAVVMADRSRVWAAGADGSIHHSADGGVGWVRQAVGPETMLAWLAENVRDGRDRRVGAAGIESRAGPEGVWQPDTARHQRFPAPWTILAFVGVVGCLAAAARPPRPEPIEADADMAAGSYAADRPLRRGDADLLGHGVIAQGLSAFLRNEKTEPPLTVAITGAWGSGKSSLMALLAADLHDHGFRPVWFNAWHHQTEENLLASLLEAIRRQAIPGWWTVPGWFFRANLLRMRLMRQPPARFALLALVLIPLGVLVAYPGDPLAALERLVRFGEKDGAALVGASSALTLALALVGLLLKGRDRLRSAGLDPAKLLASASPGSRFADLKAQVGFRQRFADEFADAARALRPLTITIVIDDLDRCRPDNVMKVLEAVNFLVTAGDCYIVLGLDLDAVERCVGLAYREIADAGPAADSQVDRRAAYARRYLEKLINIEVPVPRADPDESVRLAAPPELEPVGASWRERFDRRAFLGRFRRIGLWLAAAAMLAGAGYLLGGQLPEPVTATSLSRAAAGVAPSSAPPATAPPATLPDDRPPGRLHAGASAALSHWWVTAPLLLAALIFLLVIREKWRRIHTGVVRDSPPFEAALRAWARVVHDMDGTPRTMKRFVNRVRYLAMRRKQDPDRRAIGEATLVALAALHHVGHPGLAPGGSLPAFPMPVEPGSGALDRAVGRALSESGGIATWGWPPAAAQVDLFRRWAQGIRVRS